MNKNLKKIKTYGKVFFSFLRELTLERESIYNIKTFSEYGFEFFSNFFLSILNVAL